MPSLSIDPTLCVGDGFCLKVCPAKCFRMKGDKAALVPLGENLCIGCGQCVAVCPKAAITLDGMAPSSLPETGKPFSPEAFALFAKSRRSIRAFKNTPVPHEMLEQALDVARYAPTGSNRQDVEWVAMEGKDKLRDFASRVVDVMRNIEGYKRVTDRFDKGEDIIFRDAPCAAFAHAGDDYNFSIVDCAVASNYLELTLHSLGLGSCWAGYALRAIQLEPSLLDAFCLPKGRRIHSALMLGYPALPYRRLPVRKPVRLTWV